MKTFTRIILLLTLTLFLGSWDKTLHVIINSKSVESFPPSMEAFKIWKDSLGANSFNAVERESTDPNEAVKHFLDLDQYPEFLNEGRISLTYDSVTTIHGEDFVLYNGTLPWATVCTYNKLVDDFKNTDWHQAMLDASDLGHYVADGHLPLHLNSNWNGDDTGNSGLHEHYESDMVSAYTDELSDYCGCQANYVCNVNKYVLNYMYDSYKYMDSLLIADTYARQLDPSFGSDYLAALWSKTKFTKDLMHSSSHSLGALIFTAWTDAGSPAFQSSLMAGINNQSVNVGFYPNPAKNTLYISGDQVTNGKLFSLEGKKVLEFNGYQTDVSQLATGVYILKIYNNNTCLKTDRLVINR